jgi:mRNA interferase MazF
MDDDIRRGDLVLVALPGAFGKPRPAVVVQSNGFNATHPSITLVPITSDRQPIPLFRVDVDAGPDTGLRVPSQVMVDKITSQPREKIGPVIGTLDVASMVEIDAALRLWLDLG